MFNTSGLSFDTSSVLPHLKIFEQRLGPNIPLMFKTQFKDVKVLFGQYGSNILLEYTLMYEFYSETADGYQLIIYVYQEKKGLLHPAFKAVYQIFWSYVTGRRRWICSRIQRFLPMLLTQRMPH